MAMDNDLGASPQYATGPDSVTGLSKDEKMWGMFCHLSSLAGFIGIPFGNIIGPLIVWLIKKDEYPFVDDQGKESLNFQITLTIAAAVAFLSLFILIGFLLLPLVIVGGFVMTVIGTIKANNGEWYRYPLTIRLLK
jgi:uncharacterized protein